MNLGKYRSSLIALAGAYLIYTAYQLFQGRNGPDNTMAPVLTWLIIAVFALAGAGIIFYSFRLRRKEKGEEEQPTPPPENENALK